MKIHDEIIAEIMEKTMKFLFNEIEKPVEEGRDRLYLTDLILTNIYARNINALYKSNRIFKNPKTESEMFDMCVADLKDAFLMLRKYENES